LEGGFEEGVVGFGVYGEADEGWEGEGLWCFGDDEGVELGLGEGEEVGDISGEDLVCFHIYECTQLLSTTNVFDHPYMGLRARS